MMLKVRRLSVGEFIERLQTDLRLRQRVAVLAGASLFFTGALYAVGLGQVVLVMFALVLLTLVVALLAAFVPRDDVQRVLRVVVSEQARHRLWTLLTKRVTSARRTSMYLMRRTWARAVAATRTRRAPNILETQAVDRAIPPPTADELYGWPYIGSPEVAPAPSRPEPRVEEQRRRAVELNTHGIDLRRAGSPAAAAALHLEALEILQSLDDERAQAPTLNSLALALAANGETDAAVERFEQSLSILRERPDDPGQGEVIANLGFTLLRQGDNEHARELLTEALEKLPPESQAAHKVEAQLRRAS